MGAANTSGKINASEGCDDAAEERGAAVAVITLCGRKKLKNKKSSCSSHDVTVLLRQKRKSPC
jgi:hypothetical protein